MYYVLNAKEKIYEEKNIIAHVSMDNGIIKLDHKVTGSTMKPAPHFGTGDSTVSRFVLRDGLARGVTLGGTVIGAPTGGGVLRWELARAPIWYSTY